MTPTRPLLATVTLSIALGGLLTVGSSVPASAGFPDDLFLNPLITGLVRPLAVRNAGDGSDRLFIVEQRGIVLVYDGDELSTFLDLQDRVNDANNEQGLLGLAFHPNYADNGFFYVNYTAGTGTGRTVVERYQVSGIDPNMADPDSGRLILEVTQDFVNHNGGDLHFGPDRYLYIAMGDGGGAGDPKNRAQDLGQLLGKILRIDVDGPAAAGDGDEICGLMANYAIPPDNPFVGQAGSCDEIWAYGLRNPWRFSFDRKTGDLLLGDVGQSDWEEIDFQPASSPGGENYGWDCREGTHPFPDGSTCLGPLVDPILEHNHAEANSITGGIRYRGSVIPDFNGVYVYGDFGSRRIWFATQDQRGNWSTHEWMNNLFRIASFGEDEDGEIYVVDHTGLVYRLQNVGAIFADGFESGDLSVWSFGSF